MALFRAEMSAGQPNEYKIHQYAFQCRFGFKNVLEKEPDFEQAQTLLLEAMVLHFKFEIKQGQLDTAHRILTELQELTPDQDLLSPLEQELKQERERRQRSKELTTQIQYKLLEELQNLKKK